MYPEGGDGAALGFLLSHPANPNGVLACLSRARENARGVREQISSEMWEHLNRLYFLVRDFGEAARRTAPTPSSARCGTARRPSRASPPPR